MQSDGLGIFYSPEKSKTITQTIQTAIRTVAVTFAIYHVDVVFPSITNADDLRTKVENLEKQLKDKHFKPHFSLTKLFEGLKSKASVPTIG